MTLPATTPISLSDLWEEFGAPAGTSLNAFVRGGDYVPADDISGENSGIPTTLPLSLSDFFSANGNPNPAQFKDEFLTPQDTGTPFNSFVPRLLSHKRTEGLVVQAHDASITVASAPQFVIDMKLRVGPNGLTEPDAGNITGSENFYSNLQRVMGIRVGLTSANPATASDNTLYNNMFGWEINFYDTEDSTGVATVALGGPALGWAVNSITGNTNVSGTGFIESSDSTYEDDILPTKTNFVNLRLERGNPSNNVSGSQYAADWILTVYDDDTWSNSHQVIAAANGNTGFNQLYANTGGYLMMGVVAGPRAGNLDLEIGDVRVYSGGQTPPW